MHRPFGLHRTFVQLQLGLFVQLCKPTLLRICSALLVLETPAELVQ